MAFLAHFSPRHTRAELCKKTRTMERPGESIVRLYLYSMLFQGRLHGCPGGAGDLSGMGPMRAIRFPAHLTLAFTPIARYNMDGNAKSGRLWSAGTPHSPVKSTLPTQHNRPCVCTVASLYPYLRPFSRAATW